MNAVGIDVSKEKSTVEILRPQGVVVASPYDVSHTGSDLKALAATIKKLRGETRVVMEATAIAMNLSHVFSTNKVYLFP